MFNENESAFITAAGMPRSASTWLYNVARLLLCSSPSIAKSFSCGWIKDLGNIPGKKYMLIKVHAYNQNLVDQSKCIIYSYRDIRDSLASLYRKFGQIPSIKAADALVVQHQRWMNVADFVMCYESMLEDKVTVIKQLAKLFGMENIDPDQIIKSIEQMSYQSEGSKNANYHNVNMYHIGHVTDGRHGSWKGVLDDDLLKQIEEKHRGWFDKLGYSIDRSQLDQQIHQTSTSQTG